MMRRIQIFGLIFFITLSLVGIPTVKHFCEVMGFSLAGECEAGCGNCNIDEESFDCCSVENEVRGIQTIDSENGNCCSEEFIFNKIDDEFIFNKIELSQKILQSSTTIEILSFKNSEHSTFSKSNFSDLSPPLKLNYEIYISNHSLLI